MPVELCHIEIELLAEETFYFFSSTTRNNLNSLAAILVKYVNFTTVFGWWSIFSTRFLLAASAICLSTSAEEKLISGSLDLDFISLTKLQLHILSKCF